MKTILVPTDLTEISRRGLLYAAHLAQANKATLILLHVANEFDAWELYSEDFGFFDPGARAWPTDRLLAEATLDFNRFLEPHIEALKRIHAVIRRVVLGPVPSEIVKVAEEEKADLIVMSPRCIRGVRRWLSSSTTERVTRMSPCPVLAVTPPLPSQPWRGKLIPTLFGWPRQSAARL
jgi:universal stress protein A